jgi:hypothetical protein
MTPCQHCVKPPVVMLALRFTSAVSTYPLVVLMLCLALTAAQSGPLGQMRGVTAEGLPVAVSVMLEPAAIEPSPFWQK